MQAHRISRSHREAARKKAYAAPVLVAWGTLRDVTRHVGRLGKLDGSKVKNRTKTR